VAGSHSYSSNTSVTLSPGNYCDHISLSSQAHVTLQPGVYVLRAGLDVTGQGSIDVQGGGAVLLYNTCPSSPCNGVDAGDISLAGTGTVSWHGSPSYDNVVIWTDRTSGSGSDITLTGNGAGNEYGIVYAINSPVKLAGNGSAPWQIVADTITNDGNIDITIDFEPTLATHAAPDVTLTE
jgi:hypothetical protein